MDLRTIDQLAHLEQELKFLSGRRRKSDAKKRKERASESEKIGGAGKRRVGMERGPSLSLTLFRFTLLIIGTYKSGAG